MPESVKQPGWYPDPDVPNSWRYWTGHEWSQDSNHAPKDDGFAHVVQAPLAAAMIAPPFQNAPVERPGGMSRQTKKALVVAITCVVGLFLILPVVFTIGLVIAAVIVL